MNASPQPLGAGQPLLSDDKPLAIAILAMGGQGGGVLADWIVALAEGNGWVAQSTSVPGVAQRTGATIYYIEMIRARGEARPVLSLMPTPGDVDVVVAAEWMEGGRAILRGLVTPSRTTFVASTHRSFAVGEKEKPGDGIGDPAVVTEALGIAAKRTIAFDMAGLAERNGSVISATLFGALAASGALPFAREAFEAAVRAGGVGVEGSLRAFAAAFERAARQPVPETPARVPPKTIPDLPASAGHPELDRLLARIRGEIPAAAQGMAYAGVKRLVEWQDAAYAGAYLARLAAFLGRLPAGSGHADAIAGEAAKQIAVAMAYDDVYRVADLKIRASRFDRIRREVAAADDQIVTTTEFMNPRMEEVCGALPARLGAWIEARPGLFRALDRVVNRGRRVRTGTVLWFLPLYVLAGLKRHRLGALRHGREMAHMEAWLATAERHLATDPALALEVLACRRLVKGYSDTHARGTSKFDRVLAAVPKLAGRPDAADWVRRLKQAALMDEEGKALDGALATVDSILADPHA
ncbi:indolepyruvate oxidoreductase subunit beta family protein [Prosthecomicrobium sp. N25]|uniref:indolepyruvate oxidoreductase subunit beta family protein n=1 Tax=Prosthecomicrobium sp. N25 TaxID=3129254 RepID=UPI0030773155